MKQKKLTEAEQIARLRDLGKEFDLLPLPVPPMTPWAPGDEPHWESLDLNEYATRVRSLRKCRSFRADLRHKLHVIVRACGGYGQRGMWNAAYWLRTTRQALHAWLKWDRTPRFRDTWERIDARYADALELLAARECFKAPKWQKRFRGGVEGD